MSRLRHRHKVHSGPARHMATPFTERKHGGRVHHAHGEGHEGKERHDRKRRRTKRAEGGGTSSDDSFLNDAMNAIAQQKANKSYGGGPLAGQGSARGQTWAPQEEMEREGKAAGGGKWIAGAIKHPGALRKSLHVKSGEKIPAKKLNKAAHSSNPTLRKRAVLAKTLSKMHHG